MGAQHSELSKNEVKQLTNSYSWTKEEINDLVSEFKAMDTDHSGDLDRNEFKQLFLKRMVGSTEEQISKLFDVFDSDRSNSIDLRELTSALSIIGKGSPTEKLLYLFSIYDEDNSGTLTAEEIKNICEQMKSVARAMGRESQKQTDFIEALVKKLDKNGDGEIDKDEWVFEGQKTPSVLLLLGVE